MATLHLVATPIGNLEDITLRALRILSEVSLVAAEDTRVSRKLLAHHGIKQRIVSYNEHNMKARTPQLLSALAVGDIAFTSDAGTPGVSDPGYELVNAALDAGHSVIAIPGPSALLTALSASGLPMREFMFLGFLPRRAGERTRLLESLSAELRTLVFFESPHRVLGTLSTLRDTLGDRRVAVCREMTKMHEETFRGTITDALSHFAEPRGEFTLVVEGAAESGPSLTDPETAQAVKKQLSTLRGKGFKAREAVRAVSEATGLPHRDVYAIWLDTAGNRPQS